MDSAVACFWIPLKIQLFKVFDSGVQSNRIQQLKRNLPKDGIDCNVTALVSGLRCTISKTAKIQNIHFWQCNNAMCKNLHENVF